jgi:hypothetical protein
MKKRGIDLLVCTCKRIQLVLANIAILTPYFVSAKAEHQGKFLTNS